MSAIRTVCAVLLLASLASSQAPDPVVAKIVEEARENPRVMEHLDHLVNRIGPRLTGSDRLTQAQEWAVGRFEAMGLEARLEPWGTFPVGFNRGPWFGRMTAPEEMALTFCTPAWTPGTKGRQKGVLVRAPLEGAEPGELAALAGCWVLEPPRRTAGWSRSWRRDVLEACREHGALGLIRSSGGPLIRTSGNWRIAWEDVSRTAVQIDLLGPHYDRLSELLDAGEGVELEFDVRNHWRKGPIQLYNVVADLRGAVKPDEYVVVGGHVDSWDGATGTTDNGTGTSTTLEAARLLAAAGARPKRTIRFMLWSGEEQGLLGSRAWCDAHEDLMPKVSACLVHDGGTNYVAGISATEHQVADFERVFAPAMELDPEMPFSVRKVRGLNSFAGSDHVSFLRHGVPGYFWIQRGDAQYRYGWHTQNDTYDLAIPEYQQHSATVIAIGALGIANLDHLLSREELRRSTGVPDRPRRRLGVQIDRETMRVTSVSEDSAAARAGVRPGDRLLELDGATLDDRFDLLRALVGKEREKKLVVERDGRKVTLKVTWKE